MRDVIWRQSPVRCRGAGSCHSMISEKDVEFIFPIADGTGKLSGRDFEFRVPTPRREQPVRSENLSGAIEGESEESQPAEPTDDAEASADFWSIQGDFIFRHHNEPRVQLYVPKEETFAIPERSVNPKVDHVSVRGTQERTTLDETITSWMVCDRAWDTDGYQG